MRTAFAACFALCLSACWIPVKLSAACRSQLDLCMQTCQPGTAGGDSDRPGSGGVPRDWTSPCERACYASVSGCR